MRTDQTNQRIDVRFQNKQRTSGFRISKADVLVIITAILATFVFYQSSAGYSLLIAFVVFHFFLFCNVFRVRRKPELIWAATFLINCIVWTWMDNLSLLGIALCQIVITIAVIANEMRCPSYHGIGAHRINGQLQDYLSGKIMTSKHDVTS